MEPDFSGYATKNGLKCSDGRTIMHGAFEHQDETRVPLVWQHQHGETANVLGHAVLENRADGVYTYGFFNDSDSGKNAKMLVQHGDITALSIFANNLSHQGKNVVHGDIREVSLVLAGANPGAYIDNVTLAHSDGQQDSVVDEAVIYTDAGLDSIGTDESLEHAAKAPAAKTDSTKTEGAKVADTSTKTDDKTVQEVFDSLTEEQKNVLNYLVGAAVEEATGKSSSAAHSDTELDLDEDSSVDEVYNSLSHSQRETVDFLIGEALKQGKTDDAETGDTIQHSQEDAMSGRNVFDKTDELTGSATSGKRKTLSHSQLKTIVDDAPKFNGSLKESFLAHAQDYGIEDIDILFPDARNVTSAPEVIGRRTEWVADFINGTRHSPFSRIKSTAVDLTADEARAKGYVKGNLKKDEIIKLLKRVTTPTTIYKKQKLDRDDIVDITDLDVVAWLKAEMRLMLDEELARAILIGDGRESDDEDKIDEDHLRPIAYDADMYAHQITIASDLTPDAFIQAVVRARTYYKGTGTPNLYTTDAYLVDLLLQVDKMGRRLYETEAALAAALRVAKIVTVEVMDDVAELVGVIVNPLDYTLGADNGGNVSMFDDFDIDYNQYKYLIETRVSGALTKPKSALVIKRIVGTSVTPTQPTYNSTTHVLVIPGTAGIVYSIDGEDHAAGNVTIDESVDVAARPATGYSFPANTVRDWSYIY